MPTNAPFQYPQSSSESPQSRGGRELAQSLIAGGAVGLAGGALVWWMGTTVGLGLLIGLAGGALWWWGRPALERLSRGPVALDGVGVTVDLGVLGISGTFKAGGAAARKLAWDLHVELSTRVATQELPDDSGVIRVGMDSLYKLFAYTRTRLHEAGPPVASGARDLSAQDLAVLMLNGGLRNFLAVWHPRVPHEDNPAAQVQAEAAWEDASACRAELKSIQVELRELSQKLRALAIAPR